MKPLDILGAICGAVLYILLFPIIFAMKYGGGDK